MKPATEEALRFYRENYDVIGGTNFSSDSKKPIGQSHDRTCRFCQKSEPETTFNNESHAIPECLGNKHLIALEECDACNKFFSENLEDHFDKFSKPIRTFGQIKGKTKIPSYKSPDKKSRVDIKDSVVIETEANSGFTQLDEENKLLTINLTQEPHIPLAVYKALVKIAISIIDDDAEVEAFRKTIDWILQPDHSHSVITPVNVYMKFIPGPRVNSRLFSVVLRRKNGRNVPYAFLVLAFGNVVLQAYIPSPLDSANSTTVDYQFHLFPTPFDEDWEYGNPKIYTIDMSGSEKQGKTFPITMSYQSRTQVL